VSGAPDFHAIAALVFMRWVLGDLWVLKRAVRAKKVNANTGGLLEAFLSQDARLYWSLVCDAHSSSVCRVADSGVDFSRKCALPTVAEGFSFYLRARKCMARWLW